MSQQQETKNTTHAHPEAPKKKSKGFIIALIVLVLVGGTFGFTKYIHGLHHEETDDAQIEANISPVIPRISGYVTDVRVKDNQRVKKGDTLLVLDNRNEQIQVDQAQAALTAAQSNLSVAHANTDASRANIATYEANVSTANAQIEAAKINVTRTTQDYNRYANLIIRAGRSCKTNSGAPATGIARPEELGNKADFCRYLAKQCNRPAGKCG